LIQTTFTMDPFRTNHSWKQTTLITDNFASSHVYNKKSA